MFRVKIVSFGFHRCNIEIVRGEKRYRKHTFCFQERSDDFLFDRMVADAETLCLRVNSLYQLA